MKYLILTASTGGGHNQAADNLKKEIEKTKEDRAIIYDIFRKNKEFKNNIVEKGYDILIKSIPESYGLLYKLSDNKLTNKLFLKNIFMNKIFNIKKIIENEKIDIIISTHPFAVPIIARLKKFFKINIPFIQIVTDFKAHYAYVDKVVDAYITASEFTKKDMVNKGIDENKIYTYGIPIKDEFRNYKKYNDDDFNILIMGGSMGLKKMETAVDVLIKSNLKIRLNIVCGKNLSLQKRLVRKYQYSIIEGKIKVYGFTDKIYEIMDESKLIITKPGGLTSSEAISKCIPMLIPYSIPGQEIDNTTFLVESNVAVEIKNIYDLPEYVNNLIENKEHYEIMVDNMKKISKNYSTSSIIELSKKMMK